MSVAAESVFIYFLGYVVFHLLVSHLTRADFFVKKLVVVFLAYLPISYFFVNWKNIDAVIFFYVFYILIWLTYVLILVCSQNSVTLQMMSFIGTGVKDKNAVLNSVPEGNDILSRLEKMENNGWLTKDKNGMLILSNKAKRLARWTLFFRKNLI